MKNSAGDKRDERRLRLLLAKPQRAALRYPRGWDDVCAHEAADILSAPLTSPEQAVAAAPPAGLEPGESEESTGQTTGGSRLVSVRSGIEIRGCSFRALCEMPLRARTIRDVRWIVGHGTARTKAELAACTEEAQLGRFLSPATPVSVRVSARRSRLYHSGLVIEVVQRVLASAGLLLQDDLEGEAVSLFVDLWRDAATFAIGLGGDSLGKRGYKTSLRSIAPIKEELAACLIEGFRLWVHAGAAAFSPDVVCVPFAGSGTLAVESLLAFSAVAPAVFGRSYAVERLACSPRKSLAHARKKLGRHVETAERFPVIYCVENDPVQVDALENNLTSVNLAFQTQGAAAMKPVICADDAYSHAYRLADCSTVFLPLNPPYGERMGETTEVERDYRRLGVLVRELAARRRVGGFVLCPNPNALKLFRAAVKGFETAVRPLSHGGKQIKVLYFMRSPKPGRM